MTSATTPSLPASRPRLPTLGRGRAMDVGLRVARAALSLVLMLVALAYLRGLASGLPFVPDAQPRLALLAVVAARLLLVAAPWWLDSRASARSTTASRSGNATGQIRAPAAASV